MISAAVLGMTSSITFLQAPGTANPRSYNITAPVAGFAGLWVTF